MIRASTIAQIACIIAIGLALGHTTAKAMGNHIHRNIEAVGGW